MKCVNSKVTNCATTCNTFSFIRSLRPISTFSGFISLQMFKTLACKCSMETFRIVFSLLCNPQVMPNWTVDTFPISCWSKSDPILRSCDQYIWQVRPNNSPDASSFWSSRSRCTCISTRWSGSFPFSRPTESRWEKQFLCWIFCHTGWTGPEHNKLKRQLDNWTDTWCFLHWAPLKCSK